MEADVKIFRIKLGGVMRRFEASQKNLSIYSTTAANNLLFHELKTERQNSDRSYQMRSKTWGNTGISIWTLKLKLF